MAQGYYFSPPVSAEQLKAYHSAATRPTDGTGPH